MRICLALNLSLIKILFFIFYLDLKIGDGTNFVLIFAGELLQKAANLLRMGLHPSEIVQGYELASNKASEILDGKEFWDLIVLIIKVIT
jgi:hypothetical protein